MTRNQFGHYVEDLFEAECLFRGIEAKRTHISAAHDFTIQLGRRELWIQVKGVRPLRSHNSLSPHFRVRCQRKNKSRTSFRDSGIDFMAVFVAPLKRWHIFQPPQIRAHLDIYRNPTGRMFLAIDRWDLLGADVNRKNTISPQIVKSSQPEFIFG